MIRAALDDASDAIAILDSSGKVLYVNLAFGEMLGCTRASLNEVGVCHVYSDCAVGANIVRQTLQASTWEGDVEVRGRDGSSIQAHHRATPVYDEDLELIGAFLVFTDITERKQAEREREELIQRLEQAIKEIKTLSGLIPICASCKNIRDDEGYWTHLETYLQKHSDAQLSHSICPDCQARLYPDLAAKKHRKDETN